MAAHVTKRRPQQGSLLPDKEKVLRLKRVVWRAKLGKMGRGNFVRRVKLFLRIHRRKLSIWAANIVWLGVIFGLCNSKGEQVPVAWTCPCRQQH